MATSGVPRGPTTRTGLRASIAAPKADGDAESMSIHSLRTSVLNRNANHTQPRREPVASSSRSVRSMASRNSAMALPGPPTRAVPPNSNPTRLRPVTASSVRSSYASGADNTAPVLAGVPGGPNAATHPRNSTASTTRRSVAPTTSPNPPVGRPKSLAPSITSVRSAASTVRHSQRSKDSPTDENLPSPSNETPRPVSAVSNTSFKTANAGQGGLTPATATTRGRKVSTASTASNLSVRPSSRRASNASIAPPTPRTAAKAAAQQTAASPGGGAASGSRQLSASGSGTGLTRSATNVSTRSASLRRASVTPASKPQITPPKKQVVTKANKTTSPKKAAEPTKSQRAGDATPTKASSKGKGKGTVSPDEESVQPEPRPTKSGASTLRGRPTLPFALPGGPGHQTRKSTDTITASTVSTVKPSIPPVPKLNQLNQSGDMPPIRGVTLHVGIPCLITSKRAKYKAFARYIGEIHGEQGPWVGVEVPVAESWGSDKLGGRQWNDGSIRGIRYFEVGASAPWDDSEERAARRRRIEAVLLSAGSGKKREGDTMSIDHDRLKRLRSVSPAMSDMSTNESRGLFVRPSDVIYVFDAVDDG
jgi:hypothetical protein